MPYQKYSHTINKKRQIVEDSEKRKWFVGYDWMLLFFAAVFSGIIVTTMYQTVAQDVVDIAVYQLILGMVGLMIGTVINIRESAIIPGIRVGMPDRKSGEEMFLYVAGGFIGLELFNNVISQVRLSAIGDIAGQLTIDTQVNIALTAAVMEEALYSFAFTSFFFAIVLYMIVKMTAQYNETVKLIAMTIAAIGVGVLFVVIHIGAYGFQPNIMIMLFVNRFVYALLYIKTRNLSVPTILHLLHNFLAIMPFGL
jgi:membrane protease YdiL (CAAX protease family)